MMMVPVEGTEEILPADLVLIAAGFLGSQKYVTDAFKVEVNQRTNVKTDDGKYQTTKRKCLHRRRYAPRPVPGRMGDPRGTRGSKGSR